MPGYPNVLKLLTKNQEDSHLVPDLPLAVIHTHPENELYEALGFAKLESGDK